MRILTLLFTCVLLCQPCVASEVFTLYFVRHAEKAPAVQDPDLTQCGKERAKQLATLLSTAHIKSIYSTGYQRTMSTAVPLSNKLNIPIKNYSPEHLSQFSLQLTQRNENALIIGHSNTTPQIVRLLSNEKVSDLTESNYQILYQIHFVDRQASLTTLMQPLTCNS